MGTDRYCDPWNAGLDSETPAVCRRVGRLLDALANEINMNTVQGGILEDLRRYRFELQQRLEADGWTFSYVGGDRIRVRPPGHKKPFPKRTEPEASA